MKIVDAKKVRAVRPRICTVCRRTINAGDVYDRFTEVDDFGARKIHKSCLQHGDDSPEYDTPTRLMERVKVNQLNEDHPPMPLDSEPQTVDTGRKVDPAQTVEPREMTEAEKLNKELGDLAFDLWQASPYRSMSNNNLLIWARVAQELHKKGWRKNGD
jgi:hypothetical protein